MSNNREELYQLLNVQDINNTYTIEICKVDLDFDIMPNVGWCIIGDYALAKAVEYYKVNMHVNVEDVNIYAITVPNVDNYSIPVTVIGCRDIFDTRHTRFIGLWGASVLAHMQYLDCQRFFVLATKEGYKLYGTQASINALLTRQFVVDPYAMTNVSIGQYAAKYEGMGFNITTHTPRYYYNVNITDNIRFYLLTMFGIVMNSDDSSIGRNNHMSVMKIEEHAYIPNMLDRIQPVQVPYEKSPYYYAILSGRSKQEVIWTMYLAYDYMSKIITGEDAMKYPNAYRWNELPLKQLYKHGFRYIAKLHRHNKDYDIWVDPILKVVDNKDAIHEPLVTDVVELGEEQVNVWYKRMNVINSESFKITEEECCDSDLDEKQTDEHLAYINERSSYPRDVYLRYIQALRKRDMLKLPRERLHNIPFPARMESCEIYNITVQGDVINLNILYEESIPYMLEYRINMLNGQTSHKVYPLKREINYLDGVDIRTILLKLGIVIMPSCAYIVRRTYFKRVISCYNDMDITCVG